MSTINYIDLFTEYYNTNEWQCQESRSGPGSTIQQTRKLVSELPALFSTFKIKSILDLPCGDFNWMKTVAMDGINYTGADLVAELIADNKIKYPNVNFVQLDLLTDLLPTVDLIVCRDCLVHFSNHAVRRALFNICLSKSKYLLTTTFPNHTTSGDLRMGAWRPLNLQSEIFNLSEPLFVINEGLDIDHYRDKSMALWSIDSIKLALMR
jgi:SAM-dependent methyltransferase